jgi:Ca2+-binding RTX toxin-like protein
LEEGDTVMLSAGAEIAAYGFGAAGIGGNLHNLLVIDGRVHSEQSLGISAHGTVNIGGSGEVGGWEYGIVLGDDWRDQTPNILVNAGTISATGIGVLLDGARNTITNSGTIVGAVGIDALGVYDPGGSLTIANTGLITGTQDAAIYGIPDAPNSITNRGRIDGNVVLGSQADNYDGRGGSAAGTIFLGAGDDTAFGGAGSETFTPGPGRDFIDGDAGIDTIEFTFGNLWHGAWHTVDLRITREQQTGISSWATIIDIENLVGADVSDDFTGNDVANILIGVGGHDRLDGQGGADILNGGRGDDILLGGEGSDIAIFSGRFADYAITAGPDGALVLTDTRATGDGIDQLTGIEFAIFSDRVFTLPTTAPGTTTGSDNGNGGVVAPSAGSPVPVAPSDPASPSPDVDPPVPLSLKGGKRADVLVGGDGNDYLNGGLGRDKLTGGAGQDVFAFTSKLGAANVDRVLDFRAEDTLALSSKVFKGLARGGLDEGAFRIGPKALDLDDRILFNARTGVLSYDADGSGSAHRAVAFAKVGKVALGADDFLIV